MSITDNYQRLRQAVPEEVQIVAAAKTRTAAEIEEAIAAGITIFGENYVQEAEQIKAALGEAAARVQWHLIGHLQTNKVNKAVQLFDVIQTVDSLKLARAIDTRATRPLSVCIEINSGRELQKAGVFPEEAEQLVRDMASLENLRVIGLMTMGPRFGDPEAARPYFQTTRQLFDHLGSFDLPGVSMEILSMGMSNSYQVAIEEGSNMIRVGTDLFGARR